VFFVRFAVQIASAFLRRGAGAPSFAALSLCPTNARPSSSDTR
jgi:hypothetical protein